LYSPSLFSVVGVAPAWFIIRHQMLDLKKPALYTHHSAEGTLARALMCMSVLIDDGEGGRVFVDAVVPTLSDVREDEEKGETREGEKETYTLENLTSRREQQTEQQQKHAEEKNLQRGRVLQGTMRISFLAFCWTSLFGGSWSALADRPANGHTFPFVLGVLQMPSLLRTYVHKLVNAVSLSALRPFLFLFSILAFNVPSLFPSPKLSRCLLWLAHC
jgi:hypothetical protein